MSNLNLMLHCGAHGVDRSDIGNVVLPRRSATHYPIGHDVFLDLVEQSLLSHGYKIQQEAHGLTKDGNRYFGLMEVQRNLPQEKVLEGEYIPHDDYSTVIGLRNSHDKTFPAAIAAGTGVFVCDNLAFSGEVKIGRRHTINIMRDLPNIISKAVDKVSVMESHQDLRIEAYKDTPLSTKRADHIIMIMLRRGILLTTDVKKVIEQWDSPAHQEFDEFNVWRLFNAVTEIMKGKMGRLHHTTQNLHLVCDRICGIKV